MMVSNVKKVFFLLNLISVNSKNVAMAGLQYLGKDKSLAYQNAPL
jgi:hypothetical protein